MAGPVVHNEFFKDSIKNSCLNGSLNNEYMLNNNIYAQGHDLLLYIQLLKFKKNRNISLILSNYSFQEFIYNYLKIAENNQSINDENVRTFIYGYISHHILDSLFHPYIMQYCKDYLPTNNGHWLHGKIETIFDSYLINERIREVPSKYKLYKDFTYKTVENSKFISNIDHTVNRTYNLNGVGKKIEISFHGISNHLRLIRYDPINWRKWLCEITDPLVNLGAEDFLYDEKFLNEVEKYSNNQYLKWQNIWDEEKENISTDSFWSLYNKAQVITSEIIDKLENLIATSNIDREEVFSIIPDTSAITGLECGKKLSFIKF